jgi:hypothetical protein
MSVGYIYILSNPAMPGLLKVGYTCANVDQRIKELTAPTAVPSAFVLEHFRLTKDVEEVETLVHTELTNYRLSDSREFFHAPMDVALGAVERCTRPPELAYTRSHAVVKLCGGVDAAKQTCRRCGHEYVKTAEQQFCPACQF